MVKVSFIIIITTLLIGLFAEVEGLVEEDPIYDIPPDSQVDQQG